MKRSKKKYLLCRYQTLPKQDLLKGGRKSSAQLLSERGYKAKKKLKTVVELVLLCTATREESYIFATT